VFWDVLTFVHITMQYMRTRAPGVRPPDLLTPRHMCRRISTQRSCKVVAAAAAVAGGAALWPGTLRSTIDRPDRSVCIKSAPM